MKITTMNRLESLDQMEDTAKQLKQTSSKHLNNINDRIQDLTIKNKKLKTKIKLREILKS